jgi:anti-sigma B factor antagonist
MSASPVPEPREAAAPSARVTRTVVGRRSVLTVFGEVDLDSAPRIADAVDEVMDDGALELWLDLSSTDFMDSAGVHLLVETHARLRALNRRLAVICPGGFVRRVLELTGAARQLPLYDDRAAAHRAG